MNSFILLNDNKKSEKFIDVNKISELLLELEKEGINIKEIKISEDELIKKFERLAFVRFDHIEVIPLFEKFEKNKEREKL